MFFKHMLDKLYVFILVLATMLPLSPWIMPYSDRDSGVFLYTGWRMLNGEIPYLDIWEHKPPFIFLINALGLALGDGSRWGVWALEVIFLLAAALLAHNLSKKLFGPAPAYVCVLMLLLSFLFIIQDGNFTTEYALPIQFAALALAYRVVTKRGSHLDVFGIGALGSVAFFTKQTAIGVWISIVIVLTMWRILAWDARRLGRELLLISLGAFVAGSAFVLYLAVHQALPAFWEQAFRYNLVYSTPDTGLLNRLRPFYIGILPLARCGLFPIGLIGWLTAGMILISRKKPIAGGSRAFLMILLVNLPIEILLAGVSGNTYSHYYISMLPALSLFAALAFKGIFSSIQLPDATRMARATITLAVLFVFIWSCWGDLLAVRKSFLSVRPAEAIAYLRDHTTPADTVLMWGMETRINYYIQRRSPSRFVYLSQQYDNRYASNAIIEEFLTDIIQARPKFIVDTGEEQMPIFSLPQSDERIEDDIAFLKAKYEPTVEIAGWTVYQYTP